MTVSYFQNTLINAGYLLGAGKPHYAFNAIWFDNSTSCFPGEEGFLKFNEHLVHEKSSGAIHSLLIVATWHLINVHFITFLMIELLAATCGMLIDSNDFC